MVHNFANHNRANVGVTVCISPGGAGHRHKVYIIGGGGALDVTAEGNVILSSFEVLVYTISASQFTARTA